METLAAELSVGSTDKFLRKVEGRNRECWSEL